MYFDEAELRIYELFISVGVLQIAALIILAFFLSNAIDFAMRPHVRTLAKEPPSTPAPVPQRAHRPPTKIERQTTSRRKKNSPPNEIEIARAARVQSMLEAHRLGLKRLYAGRKRAVALRRAADRIRERHELDLAENDEAWKQLYLRFNMIMREKERRFKAWVKQIQEDSDPSLESQNQMKKRASVQASGDFGGPELSPASGTANKSDVDLSSEAGGLPQNPGKDYSDMNQEKTAALRNSADMAATKNKQDEENTHNPSHNVNKTKKMPVCRVLGDSKTIKMKFGKNNKLASLMETSQVGDGFYVFL